MAKEVESATTLAIKWADPAARPLAGSIADLLRRRAAGADPPVTLVWEEAGEIRRMDCRQLLTEAENVAHGMLRHAVPGDRVAIWARNSMQWVVAEYACALAGLVLAPWNTNWTDVEAAHAIALTDPRIILVEADIRGNDLMPRARVVGAGREVEPLAAIMGQRYDSTVPLPEVSAETPFLIQFTSGTTGQAKGALHDQGSALNGGYLRAEMSGVEAGEVQLNVTPLHHVAGSVSLVLGTLVAGAAYALMPRFDAGAFLRMIREGAATRIGGVPTMLIGLLEHPDFPSGGFILRGVGAGGAEVPEALIHRLASAFGSEVMVGYGQSECPLITNSLPGDPAEFIATTVGMPAPQNDLKIVGAITGRTVTIGEAGEICVRSPAMMRRYWGMPEATAQTIDAEGWLHTGDLGVMLPTGHVRFQGRVRDVIVRGGENIYPAEVESALCTHPGVSACAVLGIPDERWGQLVGAAIRRADGATPDPGQLETFLAERLAHFKIPRRWTFVTEFPMTASGKVQKFELLKLFLPQAETEHS